MFLKLLKQFMIILAIALISLVCVLALPLLFGLDHASYVTLLPKSITTAIGMGISDELGGYVSITVAIGSSSHAIGTVRAMKLGQVEGAMSSLSIVISGVLTVAGASLFAMFL